MRSYLIESCIKNGHYKMNIDNVGFGDREKLVDAYCNDEIITLRLMHNNRQHVIQFANCLTNFEGNESVKMLDNAIVLHCKKCRFGILIDFKAGKLVKNIVRVCPEQGFVIINNEDEKHLYKMGLGELRRVRKYKGIEPEKLLEEANKNRKIYYEKSSSYYSIYKI